MAAGARLSISNVGFPPTTAIGQVGYLDLGKLTMLVQRVQQPMNHETIDTSLRSIPTVHMRLLTPGSGTHDSRQAARHLLPQYSTGSSCRVEKQALMIGTAVPGKLFIDT